MKTNINIHTAVTLETRKLRFSSLSLAWTSRSGRTTCLKMMPGQNKWSLRMSRLKWRLLQSLKRRGVRNPDLCLENMHGSSEPSGRSVSRHLYGMSRISLRLQCHKILLDAISDRQCSVHTATDCLTPGSRPREQRRRRPSRPRWRRRSSRGELNYRTIPLLSS